MSSLACAGCGSVQNPSKGRWGNTFYYEGRVLSTVGQTIRAVLAYDRTPDSINYKTTQGKIFNLNVQTWSATENDTFQWQLVAESLCDFNWVELDSKQASIDLKTNDYDFDRVPLGPLRQVESQEVIFRVDSCFGGSFTTSETYTKQHSFELTSTIPKSTIQA